jgi:hypothetical protein
MTTSKVFNVNNTLVSKYILNEPSYALVDQMALAAVQHRTLEE